MAELSAFTKVKSVAATHGSTTAMPIEPRSVVSITAWRGAAPALADAAQVTFGLTLPQPGRWIEHNGLAAIWAGPGHWWLQRDGRSELLAELAPLAPHAGLIDMSDARAVLRLSGPAARDILMGLLPLDLHPRSFTPGCAASTLAAHMGVHVRQLDDAPTYDLSCLRSYAGSLWRALELASAGPLRLPAA